MYRRICPSADWNAWCDDHREHIDESTLEGEADFMEWINTKQLPTEVCMNNNRENKFLDGVKVFNPHEAAPSFIKANIVIDVDMFVSQLIENKDTRGQVRMTLKESQMRPDGTGGNLYMSVDEWRPASQ